MCLTCLRSLVPRFHLLQTQKETQLGTAGQKYLSAALGNLTSVLSAIIWKMATENIYFVGDYCNEEM